MNDIGPLSKYRILDLTRVLAGPWASQLLGDYGAEIIKIERPGSGDDTRLWGPPWSSHNSNENSAYFLSANRNKKSVAIDLSTNEGCELIKQLITKSDVVLENFRTTKMEQFGLGYEQLKKINPELIYCSISAYGRTGSKSNLPGYDAMIQAAGGLMSVTGENNGSPQKVGVAIADIMAGMYAATAILSALLNKNNKGEGQKIDVPLYDSQVSWMANQNMNYLIGGIVPTRLGTGHPNLVPYQSFSTKDSHFVLAIGNDNQFAKCVNSMDLESLATDELFMTNSSRVLNRNLLIPILSKRFLKKTTREWVELFNEIGIPASPVNTIEDVFNDEYAIEKKLVQTVRHTKIAKIPTVKNPVEFSDTPVSYRIAPPLLGEHTEDVMKNILNINDHDYTELLKRGVIEDCLDK